MSHAKRITAIKVAPELWACAVVPQGLLEAWLRSDGDQVEAGDPVAMVRIEDSLHELTAPARGRLQIDMHVNAVVDPGAAIGHLTPGPQ
jgi:pyruvate/2-oxoglutarate dehydrogenase complex dihydrolipoamide acyltransferase (E2) component